MFTVTYFLVTFIPIMICSCSCLVIDLMYCASIKYYIVGHVICASLLQLCCNNETLSVPLYTTFFLNQKCQRKFHPSSIRSINLVTIPYSDLVVEGNSMIHPALICRKTFKDTLYLLLLHKRAI